MDLTIILCWTCAPSCWTWPFPTPYPLWIDSPAASWSQFFRQEGARAALPCNATWQEAFQYIVWFQCLSASVPPSHSAFFSISTCHTSSGNSKLCRGSTWCQLGWKCLAWGIHLVSISKLPPLCLSSNFLNFLHSLGFNIYNLYPQQLPAFIWFHMWFPRGLPHNVLQASCFNI